MLQASNLSSQPSLIRIGISSCLLGQKVRFDGGHKRSRYITDTLGNYFAWVPVCPEVEIGLGTPRETIRLVEQDQEERIRLVVGKTGHDLTEKMEGYARQKMAVLSTMDLCGYILKKDSPTCGMERVKVYHSHGMREKKGEGLFAKILKSHFPLLPIEEEGRLLDHPLRENFITRVFAYKRWKDLIASSPKKRDFVQFHTQHRMLLLAHSRNHCLRLGQMVAHIGEGSLSDWKETYGRLFMEALSIRTTRKKHANVLYHLMGFLKNKISKIDKEELIDRIEHYRIGYVPLIVPITLIHHHYLHHPVDWVLEQTYLHPYPAELMLRNI